MTTHEMILLRSSLQIVGRCIPLCWVLGFASFVAFGIFEYPHLRLEACRTMLQHSNVFLGTVGAWTHNTSGLWSHQIYQGGAPPPPPRFRFLALSRRVKLYCLLPGTANNLCKNCLMGGQG